MPSFGTVEAHPALVAPAGFEATTTMGRSEFGFS